jgi:hypothetical protein
MTNFSFFIKAPSPLGFAIEAHKNNIGRILSKSGANAQMPKMHRDEEKIAPLQCNKATWMVR